MKMALLRIVSVTLLAGSMVAMAGVGMAGAARADAAQPSVVRPEAAPVPAADDCGMIAVRASSDDSLFGTDRADGVR